MKKTLTSLLIMLFVLHVHAADISDDDSQQGDQAQCIQIVTKDCLKKCEESTEDDCSKICPENAANECLQAGE